MARTNRSASANPPLVVVTVLFAIIVVIVGVVTWKVTKDAFEGDPVAQQVSDPESESTGATQMTTQRPYTAQVTL